jgi:CRISPR-associated protein Csb1
LETLSEVIGTVAIRAEATERRPIATKGTMSSDLLDLLHEGLSDDPSSRRPAGVEIRLKLLPTSDLPVMPPSYEGRLEIHERHLDGDRREVVELDSVGSTANRIEEVLQALKRAHRYPLPVSTTTIEPAADEPIAISTLEVPHRIFDAWIRLSDALDGDGRFEDSDRGRELSLAHSDALDPILEASAHDLLFGVWDSHRKGPYGQVRIGRSLTTTLIGLDPIEQTRIAARRDPLNLGESSDLPKGVKKLSAQGLSSIPPQRLRGGVSVTQARYNGFLSFPSLRRLGFAKYDAVAVRTMLAMLALYSVLLRCASGWDLRAGCALVPDGEPSFAVASPTGDKDGGFALSVAEAEELFMTAVEKAGVEDRSVDLKAGQTLNDLVNKAIAGTSAA